MLVATSFLSSTNPPRDLKLLNETDTDYIHVDVMDGKFVPNKTMPFREMRNIYKYTSKRLDVHLMVENTKKYIKKYATLNASYITIHLSTKNVAASLELIKDYHIKAGLAISPQEEVNEIVPYLPIIDQILIMSVEPGKGGQEFLEDTTRKLKEVKKLLKEYKKECLVSVDGGINNDTVKLSLDADMVVSGSYIVKSDDFQKKIDSLR